MSRYKDYKDRDIEAKIFEAKLKFCDDDEGMSAAAICEHEIEADTQKARTEKEGKASKQGAPGGSSGWVGLSQHGDRREDNGKGRSKKLISRLVGVFSFFSSLFLYKQPDT